MKYAKIREMDISNGDGVRVSLFVQGCDFHCKGCFNQETWDFDGGKEWTPEIKEEFLKLVSNEHISGVTILGGEPMHPYNIETVAELIHDIKFLYPDKSVWVYTGYSFEYLYTVEYYALANIDVLIDGQFIHEQKDLSLRFRGSSNQRLIDVQKSLKEDKVILWEE